MIKIADMYPEGAEIVESFISDLNTVKLKSDERARQTAVSAEVEEEAGVRSGDQVSPQPLPKPTAGTN